jgi:hypothetical protein
MRFPRSEGRSSRETNLIRPRARLLCPVLYFQSLFRNGSEDDLPRSRTLSSSALNVFSRSSLVGSRKDRKLARPVFRVSDALGSRSTFGGYKGLETAGGFGEGVGMFTAVAGLFWKGPPSRFRKELPTWGFSSNSCDPGRRSAVHARHRTGTARNRARIPMLFGRGLCTAASLIFFALPTELLKYVYIIQANNM